MTEIISKRSQQRYDYLRRLKMSFVDSLIRLYAECAANQWSHRKLLEERIKRIFNCPGYTQLTGYDREFLHGVEYMLNRELWKHMVFSYVVEGKRLRFDQAEYRQVSPEFICKHCIHTGAYVYNTIPHNLFTIPKEEADGKITPEETGPTGGGQES